MSYSFSPYTSVTPMEDGSSINSSLLTPPLTPRTEHDVPYRPTETDQTSLSMRKRKRVARNKNKKEPKSTPKTSLKSTDVNDTQIDKFNILFSDKSNRRKSLSVVYTDAAHESPLGSTHNDGKRLRRWTLPSKSAPTSVFTPLRSTVKQATLTTRPESPAMITLQRATTNRNPKRIELTFFPEPKFGNERSGLLSYIVSTFSRSEMSMPAGQSGIKPSTTTKSARSASVGNDGAHPTLTFPAATVCTEAFVESSLAMPGAFTANPPSRRCSTKYVTRDSCFEIIWDENDSSSTTRESSRPSLTSDRRPSLAATKLEAQLAQNLQTIRRFSVQSGSSSSTDSQSSVGNFLERVITPEKLNSLFPKLLRDTALRNLPRSRGGGHERENVCNVATLETSCQVMKDDGEGPRMKSVALFPPLHSHRTSNLNDEIGQKLADMSQSDNQVLRRASASAGSPQGRLGSMIGSSSHTRRQSSVGIGAKWQRGLKNKKRHSIADGSAMYGEIDDADSTPLLRTRSHHQSTQ